jgi:hypothetical protein
MVEQGKQEESPLKPIVVDDWIVGHGTDSMTSYLFHPKAPTFLCKFTSNNDVYPTDTPVFRCGEWVFWDFYWIDNPPDDKAAFRALVEAAISAIEKVE